MIGCLCFVSLPRRDRHLKTGTWRTYLLWRMARFGFFCPALTKKELEAGAKYETLRL